MWQYTSHAFEEIRPSGKIIIRVYMEKDGLPECFFLEYNEQPGEDIILSHALREINTRNQAESNNQQQ